MRKPWRAFRALIFAIAFCGPLLSEAASFGINAGFTMITGSNGNISGAIKVPVAGFHLNIPFSQGGAQFVLKNYLEYQEFQFDIAGGSSPVSRSIAFLAIPSIIFGDFWSIGLGGGTSYGLGLDSANTPFGAWMAWSTGFNIAGGVFIDYRMQVDLAATSIFRYLYQTIQIGWTFGEGGGTVRQGW